MLSGAGEVLVTLAVVFVGWLGLSTIEAGNKSGGAMLLCIAALIVVCVMF